MNFFDYDGVTVFYDQGKYVLTVNRTFLQVKPVEGNTRERWVKQEVWDQGFTNVKDALKEAFKVSGLEAQESKQ